MENIPEKTSERKSIVYEIKNGELFELLLLTTVSCNLKCLFCCEQGKEKNIDIQSSISSVLTLAKNLKIKLIDINGGEPLLRGNDAIKTYVEAFKANGLNISISSNSVLLDDELISFMKDKIDIFNVSLHGINDKTVDQLMGKYGVSAIIKNNIRKLIVAGIDVHVTCVVLNDNIKEIDGLADRCKQIGVKTLCLNRVFGRGRGINLLQEEQPDSEELNDIMNKLNQKYGSDKFGVYINHSHLGQCILLRPDGNVCGAPKDPRSTEDGLIKIGNIWKENLKERWGNYEYKNNHFLYNKDKFKSYIPK